LAARFVLRINLHDLYHLISTSFFYTYAFFAACKLCSFILQVRGATYVDFGRDFVANASVSTLRYRPQTEISPNCDIRVKSHIEVSPSHSQQQTLRPPSVSARPRSRTCPPRSPSQASWLGNSDSWTTQASTSSYASRRAYANSSRSSSFQPLDTVPESFIPTMAELLKKEGGKNLKKTNVQHNPDAERAGMKSYASLLKKCELQFLAFLPSPATSYLHTHRQRRQTTSLPPPKAPSRRSMWPPKTSRTSSSQKTKSRPSLSCARWKTTANRAKSRPRTR
jgi:hypothetical protein